MIVLTLTAPAGHKVYLLLDKLVSMEQPQAGMPTRVTTVIGQIDVVESPEQIMEKIQKVAVQMQLAGSAAFGGRQ